MKTFVLACKVGTGPGKIMRVQGDIEKVKVAPGQWITAMPESLYNSLHRSWLNKEECNSWQKYLVDGINGAVVFLSR